MSSAAQLLSFSATLSSSKKFHCYSFVKPLLITTEPDRPITKRHVTSSSQNFHCYSFLKPLLITTKPGRPITKRHVTSPTNKPITLSTKPASEKIFFDGGAHYGDLAANLLLGFTLVWLPLTLAAVFRAFFLRYRFSNLRVTVISGLTGEERSDFGYDAVKDVQVVPRFIGEWGDIIITLKDGTKVDLRSVPKFREIAKYCLSMANKPEVPKEGGTKGF